MMEGHVQSFPSTTTTMAGRAGRLVAAAVAVAFSAAGDREEAAWVARWRDGFESGWRRDAGAIDVGCRFTIHLGLVRAGVAPHGPALEVEYGDGERLVATPDGGTGSFEAVPRLCEAVGTGSRATGAADVMVSSTVAYLFRQWPYLANHVAYGRAAGHRVFLWIGELPAALAGSVGGACVASRQGAALLTGGLHGAEARRLRSIYYERADGAPALHSNHYSKIPAAAAALDHPRVDAVFYADLDSYFGADALADPRLADAIHARGDVDVAFFTHGLSHPFWNVKGSMFYLRDAPLAHRLLDAWIGDRCGFKDQYPLWHTLLIEGALAGCLSYAGEIYTLTSWDAMKRGAEIYPQLNVDAGALRSRCANFRYAPVRFKFPSHRSVDPESVATFQYAASDAGAPPRNLSVSNLLWGTDGEDDLLAALGLDDGVRAS